MHQRTACIVGGLTLVASLAAQALTFEVASIKPVRRLRVRRS